MRALVVVVLLWGAPAWADHLMKSPDGSVSEVPASEVAAYEDRGWHLMTRDEKDSYYDERAAATVSSARREHDDEHDRRRNIGLAIIGGLAAIPVIAAIVYARKRRV
jgi:hypothetical protein